MAIKRTMKDNYNDVISVLEKANDEAFVEVSASREELISFCLDRIEKLARKASGSKKPTAKQIENEAIADTLLTILAELDAPTTVSGIAVDPRIPDDARKTQRLTPILKNLVLDGKVVRIEEKGKALFSLASTEDDTEE